MVLFFFRRFQNVLVSDISAVFPQWMFRGGRGLFFFKKNVLEKYTSMLKITQATSTETVRHTHHLILPRNIR